MTDIYVAGTGMTQFGRHLDLDLKALTRRAVTAALADAGAEQKQLEAAMFSNATQGHMEGQDMIRGQLALRDMGIGGIPVFNTENACASATSAFVLAHNWLLSGAADIVLAVGAEKMYSTDRERMFSAFDGAWDVHRAEENAAQLIRRGKGVEVPPGTTSEAPYSIFMDVYAAMARAHIKRFGTTQRQIASVAAKNHGHSVHNELAQYRNAYTVDEILAARPITYPLTLPMCSPISDGAAAAILCTEAGLTKLGLSRSRAVHVLAALMRSGADRAEEDDAQSCTAVAARMAYEAAGVGPRDVSVAEVHDATAMGELIQTENLGFVDFGEGGVAAERGETRIGGRIPVNPSGGLESKGHPIGATGLGQIHELVMQLRGEAGQRQVEGARIAMAENGGGSIGFDEAAAGIVILSK